LSIVVGRTTPSGIYLVAENVCEYSSRPSRTLVQQSPVTGFRSVRERED
jgi:hypothetical protein